MLKLVLSLLGKIDFTQLLAAVAAYTSQNAVSIRLGNFNVTIANEGGQPVKLTAAAVEAAVAAYLLGVPPSGQVQIGTTTITFTKVS